MSPWVRGSLVALGRQDEGSHRLEMITAELRQAVFLDLNGTLVLPLKAERPHDHRPITGVAEGVALLCDAGFICPVVTVQSRIEKRLFSEVEFLDWFQLFRADLAEKRAFIEGPYICPHRYATPCYCKKATGYLYRYAGAELNIDCASSFVIGDTGDDLEAARILGCQGVLVRTGWPISRQLEQLADYIADDFLAASHWIVKTRDMRPNKRLYSSALQDTSGRG